MSLSSWNHPICRECWNRKFPGRDPFRSILDTDEQCCFCGAETSDGIFAMNDPRETPHCTQNH